MKELVKRLDDYKGFFSILLFSFDYDIYVDFYKN